MKVYRFLSKKELNIILQGKTKQLGNFFYGRDLSNSNKYKEGVKYIHFFRKKSSIEYIKQVRTAEAKTGNHQNVEYYVCEFDIPITKLIFNTGIGTYNELSGYGQLSLIEFAIDARQFNSKWLVNYEKVIINKPYGAQSQNARQEAEK